MIKQIYKHIIPERFRNEFIYFKYRVISVFYSGSKFYCNCCGKSFRKFLPHGIVVRKNAACPYCKSLERTRVLLFYLQNETDIFNNDKSILHIAPEKQLEKLLRKSSGNYISGDINPALAQEVVDITNIQYSTNTFDYIICSHVLGHVPDEQKAVREIYRVLKPGGLAIIMTVLGKNLAETYENNDIESSVDRIKHFGEPDLIRLHGRDFIERIKRPEVEVQEINYLQKFSKEEQERYSLGNNQRELIFQCIKK